MDTTTENRAERVLIAGGSSGMGLALAGLLLSEGAEVTIVGRSRAKLDAAGSGLGNPSLLRIAVADIAREDDVSRLFTDIGPLDHIVSTAADIGASYRLLPELDIAEARRVVDFEILRTAAVGQAWRAGLVREGVDHFHVGHQCLSSGRARLCDGGHEWRACLAGARARGRTRACPRQCGFTRLGRHANLAARCR